MRWILQAIENKWLKQGIGCKNTLIVGSNNLSQGIIEKITSFSSLKLTYCGTIADKEPKKIHHSIQDQFKLIGKVEDYKKITSKLNIKKIFVSQSSASKKVVNDIISFCDNNKIETLWKIGGNTKKNSSSLILKRWREKD